MRFRSAARWARAISGRRAANHSTCCNFIRSHGGLPITASNPPYRSAASQSDQTPGNATCQLRNRSSVINSCARATSVRARSSSSPNRRESAVSFGRDLSVLRDVDAVSRFLLHPVASLASTPDGSLVSAVDLFRFPAPSSLPLNGVAPIAMSTGLPKVPAKKDLRAASSSSSPAFIHSNAWTSDRKASRGAVFSRTAENTPAEWWASSISASLSISTTRMERVACIAQFNGSCRKSRPPSSARSIP